MVKETTPTTEMEEIIYSPIKNTVFTAIKYPGQNWKVSIGNSWASSREFETEEKAKKWVNGKPWELIAVMCLEFIHGEEMDKLKKMYAEEEKRKQEEK